MRPAMRVPLKTRLGVAERADRTGLAVVAVCTVRSRGAGEVVTLHDTGGALALARADDVDELAGLEGPQR